MQDFFDMGGYAGFVWPSYGIAAVVLALLFVFTWRLLKTSERRLAQLQAARGRRPRRDRAGDAPAAAAPHETAPAEPADAAGEMR
ncbi:heme exporter protein CcmD [Caenispirillum bisanense]|uniref:Heme exporter protein D n=1 Tax=Caenispirillum bisanense TaxID=414052 RepID=A0A286GAY1_9PROT|nr:heme exporter protein CcmD [Caenispirillum bisanense]SOD92660.1 heme exporter protein D [Caenispirillum bisanense]